MNQQEIVSNELNVLDGTMTYAEEYVKNSPHIGNMEPGTEEKLIEISNNQRSAYREYLVHAYGKAIRIDSELKGEIIFRLSQSAAIFPNKLFEIATPASPIGRMVSIARVGQDYESNVFGEYKIIDVWDFDRYRGPDVVSQRRNFASMTGKGTVIFTLTNLRRWLNEQLGTQRFQEQKERQADIEHVAHQLKEQQAEAQRKAEEQKLIAQQKMLKADQERRKIDQEAAQRQAELDALEDFEDLKEELSITFVPPMEFMKIGEIDEPEPKRPEPQSIGLNAWFYVNLNEKQYDAAHIGKEGLAVVKGVAGSGKTSVALSRTKSLSQLSQLPVNDEKYTPHFEPEAQIGIVRTGELIQYLKDTCQQLELHNFPVKEYSYIRDTLRHNWNLVGTRGGNRRFSQLLDLKYRPDSETRIEWADFVSDRMVKLIRNRILSKIEEIGYNDTLGAVGLQHSLDFFRERLPLKLYKFLANLGRLTDEIIDKLFDKTVWLRWEDANIKKWFRIPDESPVPFMIKSPNSFCIVGNNSLFPVTLVIPEFGLSEWQTWLPNEGSLVDDKGEPVPEFTLEIAIEDKSFSNIRWKSPVPNHGLEFEPFVLLGIEVLNEKSISDLIKNSRLAIFKECKVVKLRNEKGQYDKRLLYSNQRPYQVLDMSFICRTTEKTDAISQQKYLRNQSRTYVRDQLASAFSKTLNSPVQLYIDTILGIDRDSSVPNDNLEQTQARLNNRQLADIDIDLLLLLTMQMLHGAGKNPITGDHYLVEPDYYAAVFIDEVQDFTEIQVRLMSMLADPQYRAVTVVGDMGQRLHRPSVSNLSSCFIQEHWGGAHHVQLTENIRQSRVPALNWLSSSYRACFIDQDSFTPSPEHLQGVEIQQLDVLSQPESILPILQDIPPTWTAAIVWPDQESAKSAANSLRDELAKGFIRTQFADHLDLSKRFTIHQTIPKNIKGLEFDCLIVVGVERYDLTDVIAINELYVCLSRPTQQLVILGQLDQLDQRFAQLLSHFDQP